MSYAPWVSSCGSLLRQTAIAPPSSLPSTRLARVRVGVGRPTMTDMTLCIIKPHAVRDGAASAIEMRIPSTASLFSRGWRYAR